MTMTDPAAQITEALVASAVSPEYVTPMIDVGRSPVNVPGSRLQAALAERDYPFAVGRRFRSPAGWDEVQAVLKSTGTVDFEAHGGGGYALSAMPSANDGMIVVELEEHYERVWTVTVAAANQEIAYRYLEAVGTLLPGYPPPPPEPPYPDNVVPIDFWMQGFDGRADSRRRRITVHSWDDVQPNYPGTLSAELDALMAMDDPGQGGKLILFHGPPGTGKTRAILTLISEWRSWCSSSVVTDSDSFFGSATYLNSIVFNAEGMERWLLIVIEDGDEFINVNGRSTKGQAIARLLNMNDGIVGQGLRLLTLMSTNVNIEELNPAVVRPGRCMANLHFGNFGEDEANAWLAGHDYEGPKVKVGKDGLSLASLYKHLADAGQAAPDELPR